MDAWGRASGGSQKRGHNSSLGEEGSWLEFQEFVHIVNLIFADLAFVSYFTNLQVLHMNIRVQSSKFGIVFFNLSLRHLINLSQILTFCNWNSKYKQQYIFAFSP